MSDRYLLNSLILFEPESNKLSRLNSTQAPVLLNQPVSRCLELLLKQYPDAVKQRDFFDFVWGESGQNVPNNTLYQNISLLRKGLKAFGEEFDNAVITVPRLGFKLNPELHITHANEIVGPDNKQPDTAPLAVQDENSDINGAQTDVSRPEDLIKPQINKKGLSLTSALSAIILSVAIGCLAGYIVESQTPASPAFDVRYLTQTLKLDGCTLYELKGARFTPTTRDLVHWGIQCNTTPYLYLMQYQYSALTNILNCKSPLIHTTTPECVNYIVVTREKP